MGGFLQSETKGSGVVPESGKHVHTLLILYHPECPILGQYLTLACPSILILPHSLEIRMCFTHKVLCYYSTADWPCSLHLCMLLFFPL